MKENWGDENEYNHNKLYKILKELTKDEKQKKKSNCFSNDWQFGVTGELIKRQIFRVQFSLKQFI